MHDRMHLFQMDQLSSLVIMPRTVDLDSRRASSPHAPCSLGNRDIRVFVTISAQPRNTTSNLPISCCHPGSCICASPNLVASISSELVGVRSEPSHRRVDLRGHSRPQEMSSPTTRIATATPGINTSLLQVFDLSSIRADNLASLLWSAQRQMQRHSVALSSPEPLPGTILEVSHLKMAKARLG